VGGGGVGRQLDCDALWRKKAGKAGADLSVHFVLDGYSNVYIYIYLCIFLKKKLLEKE
jgi:hypothetical protein